MDIISLLLIGAAAGGGVGAGWLIAAAKLRAATAEAELLRDHAGKTEADLKAARYEANVWRTQAENDGKVRAVAEASASRIGGLEAECDDLRRQLTESAATIAGYRVKLDEQEQGHHEKIEALTAIRGEIERDLKNIANDSLRTNQTTFLELANQVLEKQKEGAEANLDARKIAVEALIAPIRDALQACQSNLAELKETGSQTYGALSAELRNVVDAQNSIRSEASKLVNALRAAPKTRGRWGRKHAAQCSRARRTELLLRFHDGTEFRSGRDALATRRRDPPTGRAQHHC